MFRNLKSVRVFSAEKTAYKRNAFGNHSKGIINLNLKLNYEKLFAFAGYIFDSAKAEVKSFPWRDKFNICFSFWWCKGKNYFSITKYFFKKLFIIQMYDKTGVL